ncbi:substrate-binding domain-containing protein [Paenibacillus sp. FSL H8-0537]|uniref:PstS family phosphate ABC transporter substrate-binding protein n=1 Tax=Paenibacillus sp. FSL H8-0537 TaxID=2921399 RepID=UPI003101A002
MKEREWSTIILAAILISFPIMFFTWIIYAIVMLSTGSKLYGALVIAASALINIFYLLAYIDVLKEKVFWSLCGSAILVIAISFVLGWRYEQYVEKLKIVDDQAINMSNYEPFREGTKAVSLPEPAPLKIRSKLPQLDGSTALYPMYAAFVQAVYKQKEYPYYGQDSEVQVNGTEDAYNRLIKGEADIIFAPAPSKDQEAQAKAAGVELTLTPIGYEAFIFFVNSRNEVQNLTLEQIQGIYAGELTNWKQFGGANEKIRPFQRRENSGSQTMLQKMMKDKQLMEPAKEDVNSGMGDIIKQTANYRNYKNAIGFSFLFYATEMVHEQQIHLLKINGVEANRENISNGTYPLTAPFYAITAGSDNPKVQPFVDWILSPQGQYLIEKTGYTPLKSELNSARR